MASSAVDANADLKQEEEFSSITRPITRSLKTNPLFHFISENVEALRKEGIEVQTLHTPEGKPYYLIRIFEKKPPFDLRQVAPTRHHLIPGYECMHQHLRIDQYYASETSERGMQGFTFAHFTEQYQHACKDEKIDIHVHLNNRAKFKGVKIKLPKGFNKNNFRSPNNNQCYDNAEPAKTILDNLLHKFTVHYVDLSNKIEALFIALRTLSLNFTEASNREAYIRIGTQLIEKINVLNNYNDLEKDQRGNPLTQIIKKLKNYQEASLHPENITQTKAEENTQTTEDTDTAALEPVAKSSAAECFEITQALALQEKLKKLMRQADNVDKKVEVFLLAEELKSAQLELILLAEYRHNIIDSVDKTLRKVNTIENLLNVCFEEGNVDKFKKIFLYAQNQIALFHCTITWITKTYNQKDKILQNLYIKICDFLCENSYVYSLSMNLLRTYMPSPEGQDCHFNLLTLSIMKQDFEFSSMLLRQGFSTNQFGAYFYDRPLAILKYLLKLPHIEPRFIKLLLAHHASVDNEPTMEPYTMVYIKPLSYFAPKDKNAVINAKNVLSHLHMIVSANARKTLEKQKVIDSIETEEDIKQLIITPDLVVAFHVASMTENYGIAMMIQEKSDIFSQALTLAMVMENPGIICCLNPSQNAYGLRCVANQKVADALTYTLTGRESNSAMQYTFYPLSPEFSGRFSLVQKICDSLQFTHTKDPAKIIAALEKLESAILYKKQYLLNSKNPYATLKTYYRAYIFLSSFQHYSKQEDCLKLMQYNCKIASLLASEPEHAWMYFNNAYNLAKFSKYFQTLKHTPEYTGIIQDMQKCQLAQLPQQQSSLQGVQRQDKGAAQENKFSAASGSGLQANTRTGTGSSSSASAAPAPETASTSATEDATQTTKKKKKKKK